MTFITRINTPNIDLISFNDSTVVDKINGSTITTLATSGNLSTVVDAALTINNNLTFNGTISGSSPFKTYLNTSYVTTGYLDFNSIARINLANGFFGIGTANATIGAALELGNNKATVFQGNTNLSNGALYFDATNGRIGIHTTSPETTFHVNSDLIRYSNNALVLSTAGGAGIDVSSPNTQTVLHILRGSTRVPNSIFDSDSLLSIEDSDNSSIQIISSNTKSGIIFTGVPNSSVTTSNKHWLIVASWDGAPSYSPSGGGQSPSNPPSTNDLYFGYLDSSTTTPVTTCFSTPTAIKGYLQFDQDVGEINFTGQHICNPESGTILDFEDKIGLIVVSSGIYCETVDINDPSGTTISINESLPKVRLASKRNDKAVFGVLSGRDQMQEKRRHSEGRFITLFDKRPEDDRLIINSVGEGAIWVSNINGNLENGDYITSCEIPGYGMKQESEDLHNYTVAKITCDCDFNLTSSIYRCEEFQFSGSTYRRAFVGCTYHCG